MSGAASLPNLAHLDLSSLAAPGETAGAAAKGEQLDLSAPRWLRRLGEPPWTWWNDEPWIAPKLPAPAPQKNYAPRTTASGATWSGPVDKKGLPHGTGTMLYKNGESYRGAFEHGRLVEYSLGMRLIGGVPQFGLYARGKWLPAQQVAQRTLEVEAARARAIPGGFDYKDRMLVQLPGMGRIEAGEEQIVLRRASPEIHKSMVKFFAASNPSELNKGFDAGNYTKKGFGYTKLVPIATFDVDYARSQIQRDWEQAQAKLQTKFSACSSVKDFEVRTDKAFTDANKTGITSQGVPLNKTTGEKYLLHGTSAPAVESILNTNFDIGRARAGWYGKAIYFADDPSKSDQYAQANADVANPRVYDLLRRLGIEDDEWRKIAVESKTKRKEVFFMFVTRVALGCTAEVTKARFDSNRCPENSPFPNERLFLDASQPPYPNQMHQVQRLSPRFNSVSVKAYSRANDAMRFREVTVYDSVVAKITHLVAYVRTKVVSESEKERMGNNWIDIFR